MKNIILANYGGPDKEAELRPYLFNLFSDPSVIKIPGGKLTRNFFASRVSKSRSKRVAVKYEKIGYSPLNRITENLVKKLNDRTRDRFFTGMIYCEPFLIREATEIQSDAVYILPMFPHYSFTTTGAVLSQAAETGKEVYYIKHFWSNEVLNRYIINSIKEHSRGTKKTAVVLSAHSIPLKYERLGDPYLKQIGDHFQKIKEGLGTEDIYIGFQSKIGPVKWAEPELDEVIRNIKTAGFEKIVLYPMSFLLDNFETKYDLDLQYKELATGTYGMEYERVECFNDSDKMIDIIFDVIREAKWSKLES